MVMCDGLVIRMSLFCSCPMWDTGGGAQGVLYVVLGYVSLLLPPQNFLSVLLLGLGLLTPTKGQEWLLCIRSLLVAQTMQKPWKVDSPSPETVPETFCIYKWTASEQCGSVLLCKRHNQRTQVSQHKISLQGNSEPKWSMESRQGPSVYAEKESQGFLSASGLYYLS